MFAQLLNQSNRLISINIYAREEFGHFSVFWLTAAHSEFEDRILPFHSSGKKVGKVHPCTGTEALYRPYGP